MPDTPLSLLLQLMFGSPPAYRSSEDRLRAAVNLGGGFR
jgi:hypothetical protein